MLGDFGYMEEGKLGKPYNLRLLKRLSHYAVPYKKIVFVGLLLAILTALLDLALPYLSKIAIDKYILASWYRVDLHNLKTIEEEEFISRYGQLLERSVDGSFGLISHMDVKKLDPALLHEYRDKGLLSNKRLYKVRINNENASVIMEGQKDYLQMMDGTITVPLETLNALPSKDILTFRAEDLRGLTNIGLILLGFLFFSFGLNYFQFYLLEYLGQNIMQDIRLQLFQRIQSRATSFFDRHPVGRLVTRVTNDIENINEMFKSVVVTVFKDIFLLTGILAVLVYLNWRLALVSFIILPFIFIVTLLFSSLAREVFRELRATVVKINAFLHERLSGMRIIQLFAREKYQMDHFIKINHENYLAGIRQIRVFAIFMPVIELLSSFAVALIIWHGGIKTIGDQLSLGALVAFISYIQMFFKPVRDISEKYNIMQLAMASIERIFEFMDNDEELPEPAEPEMPKNAEGHLVFKDVSFAYKDGRPVLENISFEVKPGEMVAVVGATGAGKTTLVNLIERFYDPDKGSVLLDGIDIRKWSKKELRSKIGLVMQDVFIFSGLLQDNVALGREDIREEIVAKAIKTVNAHRFIQKLPNGLKQVIGEGGATLSVGERQLLSFARALAHQPNLLILDEATSSIDPETERLIQDAIYKMTRKRTTLVIAHRLSTIRNADRILVMHHGRICEQGNHNELMALRGIYYKLNKFREFDANKLGNAEILHK